jgi:flavodoxin
MTVNGAEKSIDAAPVIENGRTLLPVRAVVEEMGGNVSWNSESKQATLNNDENTIILTIDSQTAVLNNEEKLLDTSPVIIDGRTFLPIRFIAESFGYNVEWNDTDKEIVISNNKVTDLIETPQAVETTTEETTQNTLIVYFSRTNTTKALADKIHDKIGGDIAVITPVVPYPEDYDECIEQAQNEINDNARPEYTIDIDDISKYNTILIGYPIWWNSVPPVVRAFLESNDLSDKIVMPFCTSGGSGINGSMKNIRELCPNSRIMAGLDKSDNNSIDNWLKNNGLID